MLSISRLSSSALAPAGQSQHARGMAVERDNFEFRVSFLRSVFFLSSPRSERISC